MDEFDIVVIGGGSAGSAAAGRLSEDGKYSVCLIEAGGTNDNFLVKTPGFMPFLPDKSNYRFDTVPQKGLNGRLGYQPRGRGLGGSSAINAMVYIRGHKWDYDNWAELGCDGWSYDDVLPYFKRAEGNERGADAYHGGDGPLNVMDQHYANPGSNAFVEAAAELQLPRNADFNGEKQEGFGLYQVTQKGGERWSAARAYVEPARSRPNFTVLTNALTEKIIVEDGRAVGVQIRQGKKTRKITAKGSMKHQAKIMCADFVNIFRVLGEHLIKFFFITEHCINNHSRCCPIFQQKFSNGTLSCMGGGLQWCFSLSGSPFHRCINQIWIFSIDFLNFSKVLMRGNYKFTYFICHKK